MLHKKIFYFLACIVLLSSQYGWCQDAYSLDKKITGLKTERDRLKMEAYAASANASQYLGQSWIDYQEAIRKQEWCEKRIKELDAQIKELEDQRAMMEKR